MFLFACSSLHKLRFFLSWWSGYHIMAYFMHKWKSLKLLSMDKLSFLVWYSGYHMLAKLMCRLGLSKLFERVKLMRHTYLWRAGLLNVKEKKMTICFIMGRYLVMFLRGGKANVVQYWWNIVAKLTVNKWSTKNQKY